MAPGSGFILRTFQENLIAQVAIQQDHTVKYFNRKLYHKWSDILIFYTVYAIQK